MKYLSKILALSVVFVAAAMSVTIANESFGSNSSQQTSQQTYVKQPLPATPKISTPKTENIVFKPYAGIDPIITGPRG